MLVVFTLLLMVIVAVAQYRNGLFTSVTMLIQVMLAGLIAFGFWEPIADQLDSYWPANSAMAGYEDCIVLTGLFALALLGMRLTTNRLNKAAIDFPIMVQQITSPAAGALTGYLLAGFLICVFQTLPIEETFFGFEPRRSDEPGLRSYLPPDRVWLALMRHAGAYPLCWNEDNPAADNPSDRYATFDRNGTFELRYARNRRHTDRRGPMPYQGEFDEQLGRRK